MRKLTHSGLVLLMLFMLLAGLFVVTVYTPLGLKFGLSLLQRYLPELTIKQVRGSLHRLDASAITYQSPGIDIKIEQLHFVLSGSCLLGAKFCLDDLQISGVNGRIDSKLLPETPSETEKSSPLEITAPRPIQLLGAHFKDVSFNIDGNEFHVGHLSSSLTWAGRELVFYPTQLNDVILRLPPSPPKVAQPVSEMSLLKQLKHLTAVFQQPLLNQLPHINLPLDIVLDDFSGQNWQWQASETVTVKHITANISNRNQQINVSNFTVDSSLGQLSLNGKAKLKDDWPINARLAYTTAAQSVKAEISGDLNKSLQLKAQAEGDVQAELELQASLGDRELPLSLQANIKQLHWSPDQREQYYLTDSQLNLDGKITDYRLTLNSQITLPKLPDINLQLNAQGGIDHLSVTTLQADSSAGSLAFQGELNWLDQLLAQGDIKLKHINTGKSRVAYPLALNGDFSFAAQLDDDHNWQFSFPHLDIAGQINHHPLQLQGSGVQGDSIGHWQLPHVLVKYGDNRINVNGHVNQKSALSATLALNDLSQIMPDVAGTVNGKVDLSGAIDKPQLTTQISAQNLVWQNILIKQVKLDSAIKSQQQISGQVNLELQQLTSDSFQLPSLQLRLSGSEQQHQLSLNVDGKPISTELLLEGHFDRKHTAWQGNLTQAKFDTPMGQWLLEKAISLNYNYQQRQGLVNTGCWSNNQSAFCIKQPIQIGQTGKTALELRGFDLALLQPFLDYELQLHGLINANAAIDWRPDRQLPDIKLTVSGHNVVAEYETGRGMLPIPFRQLNMSIDLNDQLAAINWLFAINHNGELSGDVKIADPAGQKNLSGSLSARGFSLSLLKPIFAQNEDAQGKLTANLRFAGNMAKPQLLGDLDFSDIAIKGNWLPVNIISAQLGVKFNGSSSQLNGLAKTEQGQLVVNGNANWADVENWRASIKARGNDINVQLPPMVNLTLEPNIEIKATPQLVTLNGQVNIPQARINVEELPKSAIPVSDDEVLLDNRLQPINKKSTPLVIKSNLVVNIGHNVHLKAFGLNARLHGALTVQQDHHGLGLHGQISLLNGKFRAYGQDLVIRKGQLLFAGPVAQPLINLEAIRNPDSIADNVIAGIRVSGIADEPKVELFSEPLMEQQQILSYLLRGQGLDNEQDSDNDFMTAMLIGLGAAQSGRLVGNIGETFGIHDLSLDTQGVGDNSQVVVSGHISRNLQVKYGIGIFDSLATFTVRYRLMSRLYLEAVSGLEQAVDLIYQFNF